MHRGRGSSSPARGRGSSSPARGRGRHTWRKFSPDSSPVQADASSYESMSGSLDRKSNSSLESKGHHLYGAAPQNNDNVTPAGRLGQKQGNYTFRGGGSFGRKTHSSWQVIGHSLDGVFSQNDDNVTPAARQDLQRGSSSFEGESNLHGGMVREWRASSKASITVDSSHGKQFGLSSVEAKEPSNLNQSFMESADNLTNMSHLSLESVVKNSDTSSRNKVLRNSEGLLDNENNEHSDYSPVSVFDICPPKSDSLISLKPSLLAKNKEKRNEMKNSVGGLKGIVLRPGMVLLQSYLSISEQVEILKICRNHGVGPAGFYEPVFREGGKLHLKMMCFGKFWDPETNKYEEVRPIDNAKPPSVPQEFLRLVDRSIKDSHSLIAKHSKVKNVESVLSPVNPDICLVNYYSKTGRLGLHQDKDESQESISKGIPIVSFSIGDSAEFRYGDQADVEKANTIKLKSGDVLIFGGKSRRIFHGVSKILPDTAPASLLKETNFRSGRLNLTFRQHA